MEMLPRLMYRFYQFVLVASCVNVLGGSRVLQRTFFFARQPPAFRFADRLIMHEAIDQ